MVEIEKSLLERAEKIIRTKYTTTPGKIPAENIEGLIEDLLDEIDNLQDDYKRLLIDREENYRPLTPGELYD